MNATSPLQRAEMEAFWMPFTANRQFKANPRMLARAEGMHYWTPDGRQILDAVAGLWCVNAGHGRKEITEAVSRQIATMEYAPPFQMGHPGAFQLANEVASWLPPDLGHIFFTNSGSESVDTALKIALAYHRARGEASRTRFIGRERGYHGVGFGGISVGGMVNNRKWFGSGLPGVDHLPHTHDLKRNAYTPGRARARRQPGRRTRAAGGAARREQHRRGDRRAGGRIDRRADSAEGLPAAPARALHEARHPADLRRSHHRLRPARRGVRHRRTSASSPT